MNRTKFTVIVPTRERCDTLYHCLRTIIQQQYADLEILVSDNDSQDTTRATVESLCDARIRYINTGKRVSMSQNWEFALSHVTDGWVTFLGDDDGLLPDSLTHLDLLIRKNNCEALTSRKCAYHWPGVHDAGQVTVIPNAPLSGSDLRDSKVWLSKLLQGQCDYWDLPSLYQGGFASINLINRARGADGTFFKSSSPDIYSAIALASKTSKYLAVYRPIAIEGTSLNSTGGSAFRFTGNPEPLRKFLSEDNIRCHARLATDCFPKSIPIAVYESYLQAHHLHQDFLKVKIESQLALGLAQVDTKFHAETMEFVLQIVNREDLHLPTVISLSRKYQAQGRLHNPIRFIFGPTTYRSVGDLNVFEASQTASAIILAKSRRTILFKDRAQHWIEFIKRRIYFNLAIVKTARRLLPTAVRVRLRNFFSPSNSEIHSSHYIKISNANNRNSLT